MGVPVDAFEAGAAASRRRGPERGGGRRPGAAGRPAGLDRRPAGRHPGVRRARPEGLGGARGAVVRRGPGRGCRGAAGRGVVALDGAGRRRTGAASWAGPDRGEPDQATRSGGRAGRCARRGAGADGVRGSEGDRGAARRGGRLRARRRAVRVGLGRSGGGVRRGRAIHVAGRRQPAALQPAGPQAARSAGVPARVRRRVARGDRGAGGGGRMSYQLSQLQLLESEAIYIMREVAAEFERPVLLFSGGKDSIVMLRLAQKAFHPARMPFPVMHVDTGHNFAEVLEFRDRRVGELGVQLIVAGVQDAIERGLVREPPDGTRNRIQTPVLLDALEKHRFTAVFGGARRDEDKARAKERVFSFRDEFGQWDPKNQRPELWNLYNTRVAKGEHMRVFPISNWTELDVWQYIARERLAVPSIYYAHRRPVVRRNGLLVPVTDITLPREGEKVEELSVRFRTVGDISCTCPVESVASTPTEIVAETALTAITERGATRMDDQTSEASMERRKKEGYF